MLVFTSTLRLAAAWMTRFDDFGQLLENAPELRRLPVTGLVSYIRRVNSHKGGANNGLFLQIADDSTANDVVVPETDYTFGPTHRCAVGGRCAGGWFSADGGCCG